MLLIANKEVKNPDVTFFWYNCLVIVSRRDDEGWVANRVLLKSQPAMKNLQREITQIGAVSNDASKVLVKVLGAEQENPSRIVSSWKTMRLSDGHVINEGRHPPKDFDGAVEKR